MVQTMADEAPKKLDALTQLIYRALQAMTFVCRNKSNLIALEDFVY